MTLKDNLPKFIAEEKYTSEILDDLWEEIENYCNGVDYNDTFSEIEEIIDNYIEEIMEEEDE